MLGAIDIKRGTKVSGSRFYFLARRRRPPRDRPHEHGPRQGARRRLHAAHHARRSCGPRSWRAPGSSASHADEVYYLPADDLYLTGTSEVALAGYHSDEILDLSSGPLRYAGWSTCYRREAGAAGKDNRGHPARAPVQQARDVQLRAPRRGRGRARRARVVTRSRCCRRCGLSYRVIDVAAGDLGSSAARKFDIEAWVPTQGTYRELTRTSNCTTFQARRLDIRYRTGVGQDGAGRDAQRHPGDHALARRDPRDAPAGRRLGRRARGPAPLPRRPRGLRAGRVSQSQTQPRLRARRRARRPRRDALARRPRRRRHDHARGRHDQRRRGRRDHALRDAGTR